MKVNEAYNELYTSDKRYHLLTGGRGSGKSFEVSAFLCKLSYELNQRILFTRYTMSSAEQSIIPEFLEKIELLQLQNDFHVTKNEIINLKTNSVILFSGIKTGSSFQTAKLKGVQATTWVVDEAEEFTNEKVFDDIDLSIRSKKCKNRVIIIMNPSNTEHWIYKRFIRDTNVLVNIEDTFIQKSTYNNLNHIHTTYKINEKNLSKSFIDSINDLKSKDVEYYNHKILGKWVGSIDGALFSLDKLKYIDDLPKDFDGISAYIDVSDEGTDSTCCVVFGVKERNIYIIDIYFSAENTDVTIDGCALMLNSNSASYVRVESNSMGAMFGRELQKKLTNTKVLAVTSSTNKHTKIYLNAPSINNYFKFVKNKSNMYQQALNQLVTYTVDGKAKHDDCADALTGAYIFAKSLFKNNFI